MHRILIVALASVLLFPMLAHATNATLLPSRKAAVVLPLLKQFSPKDGYARIVQILGKEDVDAGNAIHDCFYWLDDGTNIRVRAEGNEVLSIFHQRRGIDGTQVIFALDKTWEH